MPCVAVPAPPAPTLPDGITLDAALPTGDLNPEWCCKILGFPSPTPPVPLPPGTIAALAPLNAVLDEVLAYLDDLAIPCPKE